MLIEVDALDRALNEMKKPIHPLQYNHVNLYYDNSLLILSQLEREWLSVTEDYGIF